MSIAIIDPGHPQIMIALDSSAHNIPTAYDNTAGSAIRTGASPNSYHFALVNYTSAALAISFNGVSDYFICPASNSNGPGTIFIENVVIGQKTSIRSLSGSAISSGLVYLMVW